MNLQADQKPFCSWEQAIDILRKNPQHQKLIYDAYLAEDAINNCYRFAASPEFGEVLRLIGRYHPGAREILDIPAGNGIATFAFAKAGFAVTSVEPDPSESVGRGAIRRAISATGLSAKIVASFGENLPFEPATFDIVYVRQGLHHAQDLSVMVREYFRVLRPGGLLLACREHVVDNYGRSLRKFLDSQVDHQLYGGENAFTLKDYRSAFATAGFQLLEEFGPFISLLNLHPNTPKTLEEKILATRAGRLLRVLLPGSLVVKVGMWHLRRAKIPGRLHSFVLRKTL